MTGVKRERSTTPETKPATTKGSPKNKTPSTKAKGEDGAKDDKARPWTAEEDAALMSGVREVIAKYQPDYSVLIPKVTKAGAGPERTKEAIAFHWYVVKRRLLEQAGEEKAAKKVKKA